jgi:hypothetical protein
VAAAIRGEGHGYVAIGLTLEEHHDQAPAKLPSSTAKAAVVYVSHDPMRHHRRRTTHGRAIVAARHERGQ